MKMLLMLILSLANVSFATEYSAACVGNRGKVSISVFTENNRVYFRYSNAMGSDDFPLYEGVVTKLTLPVIKIAEEELALLDQHVLVSWPLEKCQFNKADPLIMECGGDAIFHYPANTNLNSYTFITSRVTEQSLTNKYEIFKVRWGIDSPGFHHSLAMPFDPKSCKAVLKE